MKTALAFAACIWVLTTLELAAQETPKKLRISAGVAEANIVKKVDPAYPEMARIARIQGRVVLSAQISTEGKVISVRAVSGHPILIQSAIDAVHQWEYRPYLLDGQPVEVDTIVEVPFSLRPKEEAARFEAALHDYRAKEEACRDLISRRAYAEAESVCATLPQLSEKLDPGLGEERVRAYRNIGIVFFVQSKFQDALEAFQRELATAKAQLSSDHQDLAYAHADTARALEPTGSFEKAASHYKQAVEIMERNYKEQISDPLKRGYANQLRPVLREYASLLRQMGNEAEAQKIEKKERDLPAVDFPHQ